MHSIPPPPCIEYVKKMIEKDEQSGRYIIPQDLDMTDIPQKVVDSFLDFINKFEFDKGVQQVILEQIKEGNLVIKCD